MTANQRYYQHCDRIPPENYKTMVVRRDLPNTPFPVISRPDTAAVTRLCQALEPELSESAYMAAVLI